MSKPYRWMSEIKRACPFWSLVIPFGSDIDLDALICSGSLPGCLTSQRARLWWVVDEGVSVLQIFPQGQQFPEPRQTQYPWDTPACLFVNLHANMWLS